MFWYIHQIVTFIHIFLGIIWVGGILFIGWGVYPAMKIIRFRDQQLFLQTLMKRTHILFTLTGVGVILTGVILGTVLGPIRSFHVLFETRYGNIWLTAFILALITLAWGVFVGYKQSMKVLNNAGLWELADKGYKTALNQALIGTAILESVEVVGFVGLIICMVLIS